MLGVYRPTIGEETWREQWQVTEDDELTRDHFEKLVLIEAVVDGLDEPFNMNRLGQVQIVYPNDPNRMQVGQDEGLLSADGKTLIERETGCVQGACPLRFAAYLHQYDPERLLLWQLGEVSCPPIEDAPPRLMKLMPYIPWV